LLKGFFMGSMVSAAAAASVVVVAFRVADEQHILGEVVSAHLHSLQAEHRACDGPKDERPRSSRIPRSWNSAPGCAVAIPIPADSTVSIEATWIVPLSFFVQIDIVVTPLRPLAAMLAPPMWSLPGTSNTHGI